eukprot:CAMPEP_0119314546 /NCGR_PEP_ID=MMETSP1333-20130426/33087_1 /TAXON_ID=418940 /ORGANISM="Scyphosphaera apsteinii, Strain RCC1455" /LENGTH=192 /DNA_ID=CAMNT_0007319671 /DNA_START=37 /DNA_END=615 /DNA_ORIENTATION=-
MPATAGRVRMPANNRMQTSSSLNTHGIWQTAIGYDPYAAEQGGTKGDDEQGDQQNMYDNMKGLLALARMTHGAVHGQDERGGWKGRGTLRGGWAAGKDLGEVPKELAQTAADDMPDSTSSDTDDSSDGEYAKEAAAAQEAAKKRAREYKSDRSERKKVKSEKKHKKEKKSKKLKKEKKAKKNKRHRRRSNSE